jgi:hypothetical protein
MAYKFLKICHRERKNLKSDPKGCKLMQKNYLHVNSFFQFNENFNINKEWPKIVLYIIFKAKILL